MPYSNVGRVEEYRVSGDRVRLDCALRRGARETLATQQNDAIATDRTARQGDRVRRGRRRRRSDHPVATDAGGSTVEFTTPIAPDVHATIRAVGDPLETVHAHGRRSNAWWPNRMVTSGPGRRSDRRQLQARNIV